MLVQPEPENCFEGSQDWRCSRARQSAKTTFYQFAGKRILDVACASAGLLLLAPCFLIVAALVKFTSAGPVLFCQARVGRNGRIFFVMKFRSMQEHSRIGSLVTVAGDSRITLVGSILRKYKIDELPQVWNVLRGEMSLVGPRPEVEQYVIDYTDQQRRVLRVRPGITDPASIAYRHEEGLLSSQSNPQQYYRNVLLPHKLSLNLEYVENISFRRDASLILNTLRSIFS